MKIGIVGSGGIVKDFIEAVKKIDEIKIEAVYCREKSIEKGRSIAEQCGFTKVYTNYDDMISDSEIDILYIALPNSLHYEFTKKALNGGKNVICEKPFTSSFEETKELIQIAKSKKLFLFEAITTLYLPNYKKVKELLNQIGTIKIVSCNFSQYSSKYDAYMKDEIYPAFNPELSGGALYDINVYNLHFVYGLFGKADKAVYIPNIGHNGIDTSGILSLNYKNHNAVLIGAKDCGCESSCIIEGTKGYIKVNGTSNSCNSLKIAFNDGTSYEYDLQGSHHRMYYELKVFEELFSNSNYDECYKILDHSLDVMDTLYSVRIESGIRFNCDR